KQATAILKLTTMKQGTKPTEEHIQCFKQAYSHSGYQETAGIHELKRSLNTPLLDKCMQVLELPTTLEKWYELVIRLDRQWRQAIAERKVFAARQNRTNNQQQGSTQRNWQPQPWRSPAQSAQRDPNAMQVDRNRSPIRCYNCGQPGHMAGNC
ncbi:hypothetical protein AMATHDRAFT_119011, partial [Amanita thiersii Skay4041]